MAILVLRLLYRNPNSAAVGLVLLPLSRHFCDASSLTPNSSPSSDARSRTPLEKKFDSWIDCLRSGFTSNDVAKAIRAQSDSDLAMLLRLHRAGALPEGVDGEEVEGTSAHGDYIHGGDLQSVAGAAARGGGRGGIRHAGEPDILTYRTLLEEMCREGRSEVAYDLLEELRQRKGAMKGRMHSDLLASLHWCLGLPAAVLIASNFFLFEVKFVPF
ncbi:hypothetical protein ZIOFF_049589 [Zingiber officinale]|uniref:Uncharacterized protein n=1 Tax=Zingiber officinale TaxID=94328 RepID=A0A8J5FUI8_ZINOF|nr:hypothetical protein ZIOFF_049589 [Zingiber officinale]